MERSKDSAVVSAINGAKELKLKTVWERFEAQLPQENSLKKQSQQALLKASTWSVSVAQAMR